MDSKLSEYRRSLHLTMAEMAKRLGVSQSLYNKVEYKERKPSHRFMRRFDEVFPDADGWAIFVASNDYL